MEKMVKGKQASVFIWVAVATLLTCNLVIPVMSCTNLEHRRTNCLYSRPVPGSQPSHHSPFIGTSDFWKNHPELVPHLFSLSRRTIAGAFGVNSIIYSHISLLQALSNTSQDGLGALFREGTAALLNSIVNKKFSYKTRYVKASFRVALNSEKAATIQAQLFKLANEGTLFPRPSLVITN